MLLRCRQWLLLPRRCRLKLAQRCGLSRPTGSSRRCHGNACCMHALLASEEWRRVSQQGLRAPRSTQVGKVPSGREEEECGEEKRAKGESRGGEGGLTRV